MNEQWVEYLQEAYTGIDTILNAVSPTKAMVVEAAYQVIKNAVKAWSAANGTPVTTAALQGLLPDVPLDAPAA